MLFSETISGWDDWCRVFQSLEAFTPLAMEICRRHGLPERPLQPLPPGTNAVFRCGDVVLKIFVPREAGFDSSVDLMREYRAGLFAATQNLCCPAVRARGEIADRYRFGYLVFDFLPFSSVTEVFSSFSDQQRRAFALQVNELCDRLHQPTAAPCSLPHIDLIAQAKENERWRQWPRPLAKEMLSLLPAALPAHPVLVHGDLTRDNLLISQQGELFVLDFADSVLADADYELPSIVFDLYQGDPHLVSILRRGEPLVSFVPRLLRACALHDFGADLIRNFLELQRTPWDAVPNLPALTTYLEEYFDDEN